MKFKEVNKLFDLSGKVIVLTGSAGLLGSQYADILSDAGAKLILVDKNSKQNNKLKQKLNDKYHTNPVSIDTDITSKKEVKELANNLNKKFGHIDGLINNAFLNHAKQQSKNGKNSFKKVFFHWQPLVR